MSFFKRRRRELGQSMILMVVMMSTAATALSLYILQHTRHGYQFALENQRAIDIIYAMEGVARQLQYIYSYESNCDPFQFNNKINQYPQRTFTSNFHKEALNNTAAAFYQMQIGPITPAPPTIQSIGAPYGVNLGISPAQSVYSPIASGGYFGPRDITVTFWTAPYGSADTFAGGTRYEQTIVLINTCTDPLHSPNTPVPVAGYGPTYGSITNRAAYSAAIVAEVTGTVAARVNCGTMALGSLDTVLGTLGKVTTVGVTQSVTNDDRVVFQNYIKNGDVNGISTVTAPVPSTVANDALANGCGDMNNDGILNEVDLNILEKSLKGYLNYTAPSFE